MKFSEWNALNDDERRATKWHRKPHIKAGTLFGIVIVIFIALFILRVGKNETSHLNTKPTAQQAYSMAQTFVKDKLKLPASADFPKNKFESTIDTGTDEYNLNGFVNAQSTNGHFEKQHWATKLKFIGGDWSDRKSWVVESVTIQ